MQFSHVLDSETFCYLCVHMHIAIDVGFHKALAMHLAQTPCSLCTTLNGLHGTVDMSWPADLHVGLLAAARASGAFPIAQHPPHALHLRRGQVLVQLGLPRVLAIIQQAVPGA